MVGAPIHRCVEEGGGDVGEGDGVEGEKKEHEEHEKKKNKTGDETGGFLFVASGGGPHPQMC